MESNQLEPNPQWKNIVPIFGGSCCAWVTWPNAGLYSRNIIIFQKNSFQMTESWMRWLSLSLISGAWHVLSRYLSYEAKFQIFLIEKNLWRCLNFKNYSAKLLNRYYYPNSRFPPLPPQKKKKTCFILAKDSKPPLTILYDNFG